MKYTIVFLLVFSFFWSCTKNRNQNLKQSQIKAKDIVIIFKNAPEKKKIETPIGVGYSVFFERLASYFDQYDEIKLNPKRGVIADTIKLNPKRDEIELIVEDGKYDFFHYLLKKGDTLILDYQGSLPTAHLKDSDASAINYDVFIYDQLKKEYSEKIKFLYPLPFVAFLKDDNVIKYTTRFNTFKRETGERMISDLAIESHILDSLYDVNQILKEDYQYRKKNIALYKFFYKLEVNNLQAKTIDSLIKQSDSLIFMRLYRNLLERIIKEKFAPRTNNNSSADNRIIFDSILNSNNIPDFTKKYLLYNNLREIIKNYSSEDFSAYYDKFKVAVTDSLLINYINEKYLVDFSSSKTETKNVLFGTLEKEKLQLDNLLKDNEGKLIYVDFWASWCAPCRAAMPNSKVLREKFSDRGVVFLYISIDTDLHEWINASKEEGFLNYKNNLIALNYPEAELYRNLTLRTIPRYLIYDKRGILTYKNALAPNNEQTEILLEKLLMEN